MTSIIDNILDKYHLKDVKLTEDEKQVLFTMVDNVQKSKLTIEKFQEYLSLMRTSVEEALIKEPEFTYIFIFKVPNRKQILLKARLENYMLMEGFLLAPKIAQRRLEQAISNVNQ